MNIFTKKHVKSLKKIIEVFQRLIQNYKHLDHIAKSRNLRQLDRTDKGFLAIDVARGFMEEFKKTKHPNLTKVTLKMISNSSEEQKNAGIALKDFMRKAFGNLIEIDIKNLPKKRIWSISLKNHG